MELSTVPRRSRKTFGPICYPMTTSTHDRPLHMIGTIILPTRHGLAGYINLFHLNVKEATY